MAPKLSLYANLLGPGGAGEPESTERVESSSKRSQVNPATLRFQPPKRPQVNAQKQKPKFVISKPALQVAAPASNSPGKEELPVSAQPGAKISLADWTGQDDSLYFGEEQRQRGGRKARKKKRNKEPVAQDWDDLYDPTRPNSYEEYMQSEERIREIKDWKERLYAHRLVKRPSSETSSDDDDRPRRTMNAKFAPPAAYNFAPPSFAPSQESQPSSSMVLDAEQSGEDAIASRTSLFRPQPVDALNAPPPHPPPSDDARPRMAANVPPPPPPPPAGVIARAPVRYSLPEAPAEIPASEAELEQALLDEQEADEHDADQMDSGAPRSNRPGQKGFAERLLAKYGWTKGSGLGASGSGITSALKVKIDKKAKNVPGGGGRGKILGGKRKEDDAGKFGTMSEVIVLQGMVDGLDLDKEMGVDGTLVQEIGEECGDKYGRVERVFIDRASDRGVVPVFIHFTSQLSALRAVNALEGRVFNGNAITARFFDLTKFQQGVYA